MTSDVYNLIKNSVNLNPTQRGRALNLLNVGAKKRKRPEYQGSKYMLNKNLREFHYNKDVLPPKSPPGKRFKHNNQVFDDNNEITLR